MLRMKKLIKRYLKEYFPYSDNDWFDLVKSKKSFADQVQTAVLSLNSKGIMHGHQRRVGLARLKKYSQALLSEESLEKIRKALRTRNFHSVYLVFKEETKDHYMVSDLTAYDVTQRLCSAYGIEPEFVYLHTGTTVGAKNLGIDVRGKEYLEVIELPSWLTSSLSPADIENFLCIYKDDFVSGQSKNKSNCLPIRSKRWIC